MVKWVVPQVVPRLTVVESQMFSGDPIRFGAAQPVAEATMRPVGRYSCSVTLGLVVTSALCASSLASAQTPRAEISGGYQALHALNETLPAGWYVEVSRNANRWFGVVGEVGGAYDAASTLHTFMGGVRLIAKLSPRIVLVHPVLIGGAHAGVRTEIGAPGLRSAETQFALQTGLGINFAVTDDVGVRVGADYRRVVIGRDRADDNEYRCILGILLPFGK